MAESIAVTTIPPTLLPRLFLEKRKKTTPIAIKTPTNKEIRACDGSILNIASIANSQKIATAKKTVKARPATIKLILKSLKNTSFFCIKTALLHKPSLGRLFSNIISK